jgi:hypothetical protein
MDRLVSALNHGRYPGDRPINGSPPMGAAPPWENVVDALAAIVNAVNAIWVDPTDRLSPRTRLLNAGARTPPYRRRGRWGRPETNTNE